MTRKNANLTVFNWKFLNTKLEVYKSFYFALNFPQSFDLFSLYQGIN